MRGNSTVWKVATSAHLILAAMLMLMLVLGGPIICVCVLICYARKFIVG
jgi:hypothetical protein